jgi:uncharacterized protein
MEHRQIAFPSDSGTCEGLYVHPDEAARVPGLVLCHPHPLRGGDMENNVISAFATAFAAAGFAVLRFNFRGAGKSTGSYAEGLGEQGDAKAALAWIAAQPGVDTTRLFLAGYSFGARVTLAVAATEPRVVGFIVVAPPTRHGDWPPWNPPVGRRFFCAASVTLTPHLTRSRPWSRAYKEPKRLAIFSDADHFFIGQEYTLAQHAVKLLQELS